MINILSYWRNLLTSNLLLFVLAGPDRPRGFCRRQAQRSGVLWLRPGCVLSCPGRLLIRLLISCSLRFPHLLRVPSGLQDPGHVRCSRRLWITCHLLSGPCHVLSISRTCPSDVLRPSGPSPSCILSSDLHCRGTSQNLSGLRRYLCSLLWILPEKVEPIFKNEKMWKNFF